MDDADYSLIIGYKWCAVKKGRNWYAMTNLPSGKRRQKTLYMHHLINVPPEGKMTDHRDRDGLNNRRLNLRICTRGQNIANQRKRKLRRFKGVYPRRKRFEVGITHNGKRRYLGTFDTEEEAALEYDRVALRLNGDFAVLNFNKKETKYE